MHKDLSDKARDVVETAASGMAIMLSEAGQSMAIAREAFIDAFDKEASELDGSS